MIQLREVKKHYGEVEALRGVSTSIERGEIVGLLGPNGAGKTTAMKILVGYLLPSSGTARVAGSRTENPLEVQRRIGYLPENAPVYGEMQVQEYLRFVADMHGLDRVSGDRRVVQAANDCGVSDVMKRNVGQLSKGYRQRVGLAAAILHDPNILILDEPTTGLDPNQIVEVRDLIRRMGHTKTVILSTHILPEVEATCDRAVILIDGAIRADGKLDKLTHSRTQVVRVSADDDAGARELFERIPGVTGVDVHHDDAAFPMYRLTLAEDREIGEEIFAAVTQRGWKLRELRRDDRTLEQVFRELTEAGGEGRGMNKIRSIALRELRAYFNSPIAYVFLVTFVGAVTFTFFNVNTFFARGQADLRGLFEAVPFLTVLLVPALTMRLWAEEAKQGTLELLLTLPTRDHELVSGKFLASWTLAVGLALTLPLAVTVAGLGNLDWGPVFGGYLGALLLGAAYLAVGQFVSALTENQILAFILALIVCWTLYGLGTEMFTSLFSDRTAATLRSLGAGSRFESIARGVIDLRDLLYYLSLTVFFLALSVGALRARRWA